MPILCFDGDNAGRRAAARACENVLPLLKAGKSVRFAFLPEGEDPDSLVRSSGRAGLQKILQGALSLFDFLWLSHTAGRKFETPEARAGLSKALQKEVAAIGDQEVQAHYRELVRAKISEAFFKPFDKRGGGQAAAQKKGAPGLKPRPPVQRRAIIGERVLLAALVNNPGLYPEVEEALGHAVFTHERLDGLRQKLIMVLEDDSALDCAGLRSILRAEGYGQETDDILSESVYVHAAFCRPDVLEGLGPAEMAGRWMSVYEGLQGQSLDVERRQGWRRAVEQGDEAEEARLRDMMPAEASEGG